jgi:C4-dicarboxylate-specific signal transduction histidine kinase
VLASYNTDVPGAVCSVIASMRERLAEQGVTNVRTFFDGQGLAQVDQDTLKSGLEILLNNAAESMSQAEDRELSVDVGQGADGVFIDVTDSGCGIPKADWERIFERGSSTKGEGHGLGLYHVRQSLGRHGGSVRVKTSSAGQGTTMRIHLRAASREAPGFDGGPATRRAD